MFSAADSFPSSPSAQDKIQSFWDITRKELDSCRAELRNKDREIEDLQDRHQVQIKVGQVLTRPQQRCGVARDRIGVIHWASPGILPSKHGSLCGTEF